MSTRLGVHTPSNYYWVPSNLIEWCKDAKRHGVSCVTVWSNDKYQVDFCKALIDHGIEVIYRPGENKIPSQFIGGIYESYRDVGVRYLQFYNEPNLTAEWKDDRKMSPEFFAENWAEKCRAIKSIGMIPVVPPLSPGGNFWHPDFFHRMMNWWKNNGMLPDLLRGCVLGIHNRPTVNPPDDEGVCSFNGYKYYRQWMMDIMGFTLPMVAPEAGYEPSDVGHDWNKWHDWNLELIRRFRPGHPKYVGDDFLYHSFWIYQDSGSTWDQCGLVENWYYAQDHGGDRTTNLWRALAEEDWGEIPMPPTPVPPMPIPPTPEPPPDPIVGDIVFVGLSEEMIDMLSISGPADSTQPYWKIVRIEIQPQCDKQSIFAVLPKSTPFTMQMFWADGESGWALPKADPYEPMGAREWATSQPIFRGGWGSYGMRLNVNAESLWGVGLYEQQGDVIVPSMTGHHPTLVCFQLVQPTLPEPELPTDPEQVIVARALALRDEMRLPMPITFKYPAVLREHGYSQGAGFGRVEIDGKAWGWQIGFNLDGESAVAYSPESNYDATIFKKL